jgi:ABC-type nitrate/sulfonate/bicarbonate transport system permease component
MIWGKDTLSVENRERLLSIASPIALLLVWQLMSWGGLLDPRFIPSPIGIGEAAWALLLSGDLIHNIWVSLLRILAGFVIGAVPGILIGLAMGVSRWVRAAIDPLVAALFPIPKISLLPLIMLYLGIGEASKIALVALGVVFLVLINAMAGVLAIDPIHFDVAKNYGAPRYKLWTRVVIPGALPMIFVGMRLGIGVAFIVIVAAEFVAARSGIGYLIWTSWETLVVENMFVGIIVVTILGVLATFLLHELERRLIPWRQ